MKKLFIGAATSALLALSAAPAFAAGPEGPQLENGSFACSNSVKEDVGNGVLNILNGLHVNIAVLGTIRDGVDQQCQQSQSEK